MTMAESETLDPVTLTVIDNFLTSTCRDMGVTMMKTSYSPIFNESLDFSCVIFDPEGQMLAQAEFCPSQIGTIKFRARGLLPARRARLPPFGAAPPHIDLQAAARAPLCAGHQ